MPLVAPFASISRRSRRLRRRAREAPPLALGGLIPILLGLLVYLLPQVDGRGETCDDPRRWALPFAANAADRAMLGPVIRLTPGRLTLDGRSLRGREELREDLSVLARNWAVLHPGRELGPVILAAHPRVPYGSLRALAETAAEVGFDEVSFLVRPPH